MFSALIASMVAAAITPETLIKDYCEPLLAGSDIAPLQARLGDNGFERETVAGQRVLRKGGLIVALSASPRVCFIQAPPTIDRREGFALADRWAQVRKGAVRSPVTTGPDGAAVRGWTDHLRNVALVATEQTTSSGQKVMAFIVMPAPKRVAR